MPASVRLKPDWCTGHSCYPPRRNTSGSPNVFINKYPAHRVGDSWETHCCVGKDTKVWTENGNIKIEDIYRGMKKGKRYYTVSRDEKGKIRSEIVASYKTKKVTELYEIEMENGYKFRVTGEHKVQMLDGKRYVKAEDLKEGDEI